MLSIRLSETANLQLGEPGRLVTRSAPPGEDHSDWFSM
jgi:hypothetical protein